MRRRWERSEAVSSTSLVEPGSSAWADVPGSARHETVQSSSVQGRIITIMLNNHF